jgi:hypothetical protein
MSEDPTQTYDEMYRQDGYVESGVAEPGTMQEVDMAGEGDLEQQWAREEGSLETDSPVEEDSLRQGLSTPLEQRQADPYAAVDMGYKEDPDAMDSEVEGYSPTANAETIDPLEGE